MNMNYFEPECGAGVNGDTEVNGEAEEVEPGPEHVLQKALSQPQHRQSRGHVSRHFLVDDDKWIARSDVSTRGGRCNHHHRQKGGRQGGGLLDGIAENGPDGELVNGASDMVQNAPGNAVKQVRGTSVANHILYCNEGI
ncbi:hypothetical protein DM02DRAFT_654375 [Periconia macrospinosa]|uniref:Uncharacterized protein n=1 Tax=Periconia macrospinosa TaxID=97972 RepID=A0A2V1DU16_9PLEO|nr:hypothetical protein DM02DRAFT_654375 [Periconia macrospinosa]